MPKPSRDKSQEMLSIKGKSPVFHSDSLLPINRISNWPIDKPLYDSTQLLMSATPESIKRLNYWAEEVRTDGTQISVLMKTTEGLAFAVTLERGAGKIVIHTITQSCPEF